VKWGAGGAWVTRSNNSFSKVRVHRDRRVANPDQQLSKRDERWRLLHFSLHSLNQPAPPQATEEGRPPFCRAPLVRWSYRGYEPALIHSTSHTVSTATTKATWGCLCFLLSSLPRLHCTSFSFLLHKTTARRQFAAARRYHNSSTRKQHERFAAAIHGTIMAPSQNFRAALAEAEKGNTKAQASVGNFYYSGKEGVTRDLVLAFKFCRMAAEGGHTGCQNYIGILYARGEGVERDQRKATAWLLRAAEGGNSDAQYHTAERYKQSIGHDAPDMKETVKWFQAAVAQGNGDLQLELGHYYNKGDGVHVNPGLALKLWRKCARHHETGDAERYANAVAAAHRLIGTYYYLGTGVEVDLAMAKQWWTKSAELGCIDCAIGEIYLMGFEEIVPVGTFDRDVPLGMKYLRALTVAGRKCMSEDDAAAISRAEFLIRDFHEVKSCMGCGSAKARKLCSGCLDFDCTKVRYCGEACQLIHWRHETASHKAECGSCAATNGREYYLKVMRLTGLVGAAHLNGREGVLTGRDLNNSERFTVRLQDGKDISVRRVNYEVVQR
jgi:TPR repeat protein